MKTLEAGRQNFGDLVQAFGRGHVLWLRSVHACAPQLGAGMRSLRRDEKLNQVISEMLRKQNKYGAHACALAPERGGVFGKLYIRALFLSCIRETLRASKRRVPSTFMGHQRLGILPRSKAWRDVVALIGGGADVAEVARAVSAAAEQSMIDASEDAAVRHSLWLLARIPLAAKAGPLEKGLRDLGLGVNANPTLVDLVCAVTLAIDRASRRAGPRTDFGEISQLSASESLYAVVEEEMRDLLDPPSARLQGALASFSSPRRFAALARDFFARLIRRHVDYYLSRELANHVGPGRRFASVREHTDFEKALELHCAEATRIIKEYAGEWLNKHNFEGGIDQAKAGRFVAYASEKVRAELRHRRDAHVA